MANKVIDYIKTFLGRKRMFKVNSDRLVKSINEKWKLKSCPMCGHNNWHVDNRIVTPMIVSENKDIQLGGKFIPLVTVTCTYCGNVIFVNPLVVGAIDQDEDTK